MQKKKKTKKKEAIRGELVSRVYQPGPQKKLFSSCPWSEAHQLGGETLGGTQSSSGEGLAE